MISLHSRPLVRYAALALVMAWLTLAVAPAHAAPHAPVVFRCEPAAYMGRTTEQAVIDLYAEDAADLYGLDVKVSFNPSIARVVDKDASAAGVQLQPLSAWFVPGFIVKNEACNTASGGNCPTAGQMWYAATQYYPQLPIQPSSPSGAFARVTFAPQAEGVFEMQFVYHKVSDENGVEIPSTAESCRIEFQTPTGVGLAEMQAVRSGSAVRLNWTTASEHNVIGFNLYRGAERAGPWRKLTTEPVWARFAGTAGGGRYEWDDKTAAAGGDAWYVIEELTADGAAVRDEPIRAAAGEPNAVRLSALRAEARPNAAVLLLVAAAVMMGGGLWRVKHSRG